MPNVTLRETTQSDISTFFEIEKDPEARHMAAFTAKERPDRAAFDAHWTKILANPDITQRTIVYSGQVAGSISCYPLGDELDIGYWIDKQYWGKGIATEALRQLLQIVSTRPIYASAAADNAASIRVLQKCGFTQTGEDTGYAPAREGEIREALFVLE